MDGQYKRIHNTLKPKDMIKVKKPTKKQLSNNAKKMKAAMEKFNELKKREQK